MQLKSPWIKIQKQDQKQMLQYIIWRKGTDVLQNMIMWDE